MWVWKIKNRIIRVIVATIVMLLALPFLSGCCLWEWLKEAFMETCELYKSLWRGRV